MPLPIKDLSKLIQDAGEKLIEESKKASDIDKQIEGKKEMLALVKPGARMEVERKFSAFVVTLARRARLFRVTSVVGVPASDAP